MTQLPRRSSAFLVQSLDLMTALRAFGSSITPVRRLRQDGATIDWGHDD